MVCPKCNSQLPEGSSFCPRCGVRIVTERRCPKCQSMIAADSVFCPKCGTRMAGSAPTGSAPAGPAPSGPAPARSAPASSASAGPTSAGPTSAGPTSAGPAFTPASAPAPTPPAKNRIFTWKNLLIVIVVGIAARGLGYLIGSTWSTSPKSVSSTPSIGTNINTDFDTGVKLKKDFDVKDVVKNDYTVSLVNATVYEDDDGEPILVLKYDFTNNSNESQSFIGATYDKAFQNGVQLSPAILIGTQYNYDVSLASKEVQPGVSMEVQRAYHLDHPTADVEVEVVTLGIDPVTLFQSTVLLPE